MAGLPGNRHSVPMRTPQDAPTDPDELIRFGTVASVDLGAARCTVRIDEEAESPPLRWIEARMGTLRTWSPPSLGEQVVLLCPAGEIAAAVVLRGLVCDAFPAPDNTEIALMRFADGAVIAYDPQSHELAFELPDGATASILATGGVAIDGPLSVNGDVTVTGTVTASVDVVAGGKSLKTHVHPGVQAGGSQTGAPL